MKDLTTKFCESCGGLMMRFNGTRKDRQCKICADRSYSPHEIHTWADRRIRIHGDKIGQAYFRAAMHFDPEWAMSLQGSLIDCFLSDTRVAAFLDRWYEEHPNKGSNTYRQRKARA